MRPAGALLSVAALVCEGGHAAALASAAPAPGAGTARVISTIVGGPGGPALATTVALQGPCGVSFASGALYVGAGVVREVSIGTGQLTTPAGSGAPGPLGDGVPATTTALNTCGVTVDPQGNLVVAAGAASVAVVAASSGTFYGQAMTAGDIYTIAGNGTAGFSGDGGPAVGAELNAPNGVSVDAAGNVVIADQGNSRVRVVAASNGTFYGQAMTAGDIYTIAGTGTAGFSGDGGPAVGAELDVPGGVTLDAAGNVVIADQGNSRVRVVAASSGTFYGQAMTAGDIYTIAGTGTAGFSGDGGPAIGAELICPTVCRWTPRATW